MPSITIQRYQDTSFSATFEGYNPSRELYSMVVSGMHNGKKFERSFTGPFRDNVVGTSLLEIDPGTGKVEFFREPYQFRRRFARPEKLMELALDAIPLGKSSHEVVAKEPVISEKPIVIER